MFFVFFFCIFIELVVLIQRNSALRNEALAYLISELRITRLHAVCFSLLVEETAINYGCRKRQNIREKNKIKVDKAVSPFKKLNWSLVLLNCSKKLKFS